MLDLFWVEFTRGWLTLRRYPLELLGAVVSLSVFFLFIYLGARYLAGPGAGFGERMEDLLVGYLLWTLVLFAYSSLAFGLSEEASTGTLEQVFLSPYGPLILFSLRALAGLGVQLLLTLSIGLLLALLTGARPALPLGVALPALGVLLGGYGLGFGVASLALLYKRVQQLIGLSQFLLLAFLLFPVGREGWGVLGYLLPLAPGSGLVRGMMVQGQGLDPLGLLLALLNGMVYLLLGLLLFHKAVQRAKARGLLFGY